MTRPPLPSPRYVASAGGVRVIWIARCPHGGEATWTATQGSILACGGITADEVKCACTCPKEAA